MQVLSASVAQFEKASVCLSKVGCIDDTILCIVIILDSRPLLPLGIDPGLRVTCFPALQCCSVAGGGRGRIAEGSRGKLRNLRAAPD